MDDGGHKLKLTNLATTTSKAELALEPYRCWHGPFWIILNWLVATGLRWYGYEELSDAIDRGSIRQSGFGNTIIC